MAGYYNNPTGRYALDRPLQASDRKLRLSALQQAVLHWLRREQRRRPRLADGSGIPYPDLARALGVDRAELSTCLRRLIRKRLVVATLPRGSWVRYVALTDKGEARPQPPASKAHKKHRDPADLPRRKGKMRRRGRRTPPSEMDG